MHKTIGMVLLAALVFSGIAYADGRVLSVVSPSVEELKEPAKAAKPAHKVSAKKAAKKVTGKTAKKKGRKVAAPAKKGEAAVQPVGSGHAEKPKAPEIQSEGKDSKEAPPLMVPKPQMVNLGKQHADEKTAKVEKPKIPGQVYVLFQSKPANAEVVVDGYYAGSTPLELPIKEGNHNLRVIYPGYDEWERKFSAYRGMRVSAILVEKKQAPATP